jgi:hypothetical protein
MTDTPKADEPRRPFNFGPPGGSPASAETAGLAEALNSLSIALKALHMVTQAAVSAADGLAADADADEVRDSWLASLMPLRYTVHHLQFRGTALIRAISERLANA